MRILFIHNYYKQAGGEDQVVAKEVNLLKERGHEVSLLAFHNDQLASGWKIIPSFFYNKTSYQQTLSHLQHFRPEVVHVHNFFYQASISIFEAIKKMKIPIVLTLHNYRMVCANALLMREDKPCELCLQKTFPIEGIRHKCFQDSYVKTALLTSMTAWNKWNKRLEKLVDKVIVLTEFAKQKILTSSLQFSPDQLVVKPNSVDDSPVLTAAARQHYYVFVGRLSKEKGIETIMQAASQSTVPIMIIGDGPLKGLVEERANKHAHLQCLGKQPHSQVMQYIQESYGLILPSTCYEGLPTTVLEAFAAGTPVIASDLDNLNTIITNHQNGLSFRTGDGTHLKECLLSLDQTPKKRAELGRQARLTYKQYYTHEQNYQQLFQLYESLLQHGISH